PPAALPPRERVPGPRAGGEIPDASWRPIYKRNASLATSAHGPGPNERIAPPTRQFATLGSRPSRPFLSHAPEGAAPPPSLHGDALRQVARLIDVGATVDSHVVREQLERKRQQDRRQQLVGRGHLQHLPGDLLEIGGPGIGDHDDAPAARLDLLQV